MSIAFRSQPQLIFVRFEQGRGRTGVPKTWMAYTVGHPNDPQAKPEITTLVKMALGLFRAMCADANQGHGRDLMPGTDDEYELHNVDGNRIEKVDQIKWETVQIESATPIRSETRAELVLVWKSPADLLMASVKPEA